MSITTGWCNSFKLELWQGIHDLRVDVVKAALFTSAANLSPATTVYSATGEASGAGYTAGGKTVTLLPGYPAVENGQAVIRFGDIEWDPSTITARGVLFYNSSKANRAIFVVDFGVDRSSLNAAFRLIVPAYLPPLFLIN